MMHKSRGGENMPNESEIKHFRNPVPTTDIIIESKKDGKPGIILITRKNPPFGYALPGGFAEYGLTLENNARKEAMEETNLDLEITGNNFFCIRSDPLRDPRLHTLSVCYSAKSNKTPKEGDDAKTAKVYSIDEVIDIIHNGEMCFDHEYMILDYLKANKLYTPKEIYKVGLVGRFKPFHNGAMAFLESLCQNVEHVVIGLGSSNKELSYRNPFTAQESKEMINLALKDYNNYSFIEVPDFAHLKEEYRDGQKWKNYVTQNFGCLDYFVSGNGQVSELLKEDYTMMHPIKFIPKEKQVNLKAAMVRMEMARNGKWDQLVPDAVSEYIKANKLDTRFRKKFGLETIAELSKQDYWKNESIDEERAHTYAN
jgi:8-oxo-dGTP diphosphatase